VKNFIDFSVRVMKIPRCAVLEYRKRELPSSANDEGRRPFRDDALITSGKIE